MAVPREVAKSLRKSATRIAGIQDESVAAVAQFAVESAISRGGTFFQGRYQLYAEVVEKRSSKKRSEALVWPKPAGGWAIASFGRGPVRPVRKKVLRSGDRYFASARAVPSGDLRVVKWQDTVEAEYGEVAEELLDDVFD